MMEGNKSLRRVEIHREKWTECYIGQTFEKSKRLAKIIGQLKR